MLFSSVYSLHTPFFETDTPAFGVWTVTISSSLAEVTGVIPKFFNICFASDIVLFLKSGIVIKDVLFVVTSVASFEGIPKYGNTSLNT